MKTGFATALLLTLTACMHAQQSASSFTLPTIAVGTGPAARAPDPITVNQDVAAIHLGILQRREERFSGQTDERR